ncbi:MAG TPA: phosphatidate cytidylyltransferase [Rhodobacteraceae bacterium]|nr:phosphatidate cytidylyltransferase [Paracoccaceae bacterium]|tara:strand:- start:2163 stop:2978 length:816 start_codon:yes stop_codon:yes gene_type:complete
MNQQKWADLPLRLTSAVVMLLVFSGSLYVGSTGVLILGFVSVVAMLWELTRMFGLTGRRLFAVTAVAVLGWLPMVVYPAILNSGLMLPSVSGFLTILIGSSLVKKNRGVYVAYGALLTVGMLAFWYLVLNFGLVGIGILAVLVILSDIGGYIAGRSIGGAKFWPSISPKKTWSGTIVGWVFAISFGFILSQYSGVYWMVSFASIAHWMIPISVLVVFGAQMGDIAESWVKRCAGVKDSSNLIPGHGGFLDRFDGFIGAAAALGLITALLLD